MDYARLRTALTALSILCAAAAGSAQQRNAWPQWGGPDRNFHSDAKGLAARWPADGPRKIWSRPLGVGHSSIIAEAGRLYTMYRRGAREIIIAMDAASGKTLWEFPYDAPYLPKMDMSYGDGPHSTPIVAGDLVCAAGATAKLHCVDKATGALRWKRDLWGEFGGTFIGVGYSCSPLAWRDLLILQVGGAGRFLMAFHQADGQVAWQSQDYRNSNSSPLVIDVDGQPQLVAYAHNHVVAVNPDTGAALWNHRITAAGNEWNFHFNISTPVWGAGNLLFVSAAYGIGGRALHVSRAGSATQVKQLWESERTRVHKESAVRIGDVVYASTGHLGPAPLSAIDVRSGKVLWQERRFSHANLLAVDGKLIILDEDGVLALATATPAGLTVHSRAQLFNSRSWTVPTLVGTRLYARDRQQIVALELK